MNKIGDIIPTVLGKPHNIFRPDKKKCKKECARGVIINNFIDCVLFRKVIEDKDCINFKKIQSRAMQRAKEMRRPEMCKKLRIPSRYHGAILNDKTKSCKKIKQFMNSDKTILIISGGWGCGKTFAICAYLLEQEKGMFIDSIEIVNAIYMMDWTFLQKLQTTPILGIDDVGVDKLTTSERFVAFFNGIVNARYSNELTTVLTTNMNDEVFKDTYGGRITDRIRECGIFWSTSEGSLRGRKNVSNSSS